MSASRALFDSLHKQGQLNLVDDLLLCAAPPPLPATVSWDKVEGMLLGLAIGDALGIPTEGVSGWDRRGQYPTPLNYLLHGNGPSDDTQMSYWTLEAILRDHRFDPATVARIFADPSERIIGIGGVVREFRRRASEGAEWPAWSQQDPEPLGNGAIMRVAPVIIPYLRSPSPDLWIDAALCGRITHDSFASTAACVALVNLIWQCLGLQTTPTAGWWADEFLRVFSQLCQQPLRPPREHARPLMAGFVGTLEQFVEQHVRPALVAGRTVREMCDPHGNG